MRYDEDEPAVPAAGSPVEFGDSIVLIDAICPFCNSRFKVSESLRGKRMRCPDSRCREVFTVSGSDAPDIARPDSATKSTGSPSSPSVNDVIPILPAERADVPLETPRKSDHITEHVQFIESEPVKLDSAPREMSWTEPPPVRLPGQPQVAPPTTKKPEPKPREKKPASKTPEPRPIEPKPVEPKPVEPKPVEADVPSEAQVADWRAAPPPLRSSSDDAVSRPVMTATPTPSSVEEKTAEAAAAGQ